MSLLDVKEKIGRIRFFIDKVKYKRGRHFYLTIFGLLFLIITLFTAVFINQKIEIKRKENILKSYYSENYTGGSKLNETTFYPDEIKIIADDGKEEYPRLVERVIFTTGDAMSGDVQNFLGLAGRPFLPKPFTPDELRMIVVETLRQIEK